MLGIRKLGTTQGLGTWDKRDLSLQIVVDGVDRTGLVRPRSLRVVDTLSGRKTCDFRMVDTAKAWHPLEGEIVVVKESGERIFAGTVDSVEESVGLSSGDSLEGSVRCVGFEKLFGRFVVSRRYVNETVDAIVTDICTSQTELVNGEGILLDGLMEGPIVHEATFDDASAEEALDDLAELFGWIWYVDDNRVLWFFDRTLFHGRPFKDTGNDRGYREATLKRSLRGYRNRQIFRAGKGETPELSQTRKGDGETRSFSVSHPISRGQINVTTSIEAVSSDAGDTTQEMTVLGLDSLNRQIREIFTLTGTTPVALEGGFKRITRIDLDSAAAGTVTVRNAGAGATVATLLPGEILLREIDANPIIEVDTGSGFVRVDDTAIGIRDVDAEEDEDEVPTQFKWFWKRDDKEVTQNKHETVLATTHTVRVTFVGRFPLKVVADNFEEQSARAAIEGGTGIYVEADQDETVDGLQAAAQRASGILAKHDQVPVTITLETHRKSYRAGQLVRATFTADHAFDEEMIVDRVSTTEIATANDGSRTTVTTVELSRPDAAASDYDFWKRLIRKGRKVTIQENQKIHTVRKFVDSVTMNDDSGITLSTSDQLPTLNQDAHSFFSIGTAVMGKIRLREPQDQLKI